MKMLQNESFFDPASVTPGPFLLFSWCFSSYPASWNYSFTERQLKLSLRPDLASLNPMNTASTIHMCKIQDPVVYRKEFDSMLALAWVECFLPIFLWVGNCVFAGVGDKKFKLAGTALCGLLSLIAGPMYLTWYYQCPAGGTSKAVTMHNCFKTHVSLSLGCVILGALAVVQVVFVFLRVIMCAECGSGFRLKALFGAIFMLTITALVTFIPLGSVAIGWKYAFGDCETLMEFETVALGCTVNKP